MAAVLSATIKLDDQMSAGMEKVANAGAEGMEKVAAAGGLAANAAIEVKKNTEDMGDAVEKTVDGASENIGKLRDAVEKAGKQGKGAGEEGKGAGNDFADAWKRASEQAKQLGEVLASAGLIAAIHKIASAFFDCSNAAAEFELQLAKVSTIADTSQVSMGAISNEITALSMQTGKSVAELSDASYQALSAGVDTANAVSFAGSATQLAVGGFTSASTAVDVLTTALNAYGLEASEATSVSDMLVTTQNLGKTTVDELAATMGRVIPLASAYGVEMDNLSSAFAVMTANGIATAETTTYVKSMLGELGSSSSDVASVLKEETGMSFAELTAAGYSLGDVMAVLGDSVGGDATAFNELWSSAEAGIGALSIYNSGAERYNEVMDAMQDSAGATADAYAAMTNTTVHGSERMSNSFNNLQIGIGTAVNPAMNAFYNVIADVVDGITGFVNRHPALVSALSTFAGIVLTAVAAVAAYSAATTIATAVTGMLGTSVAAAFWPVTLVAGAVAGLTAGVVALVNIMSQQNAEFNSLTATSKQQYEQLERLNDEYAQTVEMYGENSAQARQLSQEIAGLEAQYDGLRMTIDEFVAKNDALIESHDKLMESFAQTNADLDKEERGTAALIDRLEALASASELSAGEQMQMSAIVDKLNKQIPGLKLNYDEMSGSLNKSASAIKDIARAQAEQNRFNKEMEQYAAVLEEQSELSEQLAKATDEVTAAQERYSAASGWDQFWNVGNVKSDLETFTAEQERLQAALDETNQLIAEHEEKFDKYGQAAEDAANDVVDYETAVTRSVNSVTDELNALAEQYDDAYAAARESIHGQIGLFDTMKTESELSINDMQKALQSQIDYLATYTENLQKAAEYGIDAGLIASLSDGSEESAGYINAIVSNVERLGEGSEGAAAFVEDFNGRFQEVEKAKDSFADTVAKMDVKFDETMDEIEGRLQTSIENMNMEKEAAGAAQATISAYIEKIRSMTGEAHDAAAAVSAATNAALSGGARADVSDTPHYAKGTADAADVFVAGEEGPELVVGAGGSTVFTADETSRILSAANAPVNTSVPESLGEGNQDTVSEKKITLEISGSGSIDVSGGYDEARVSDWLYENIKPALMRLLKREVYEEGDLAYEF